jgi:hypothetical protein
MAGRVRDVDGGSLASAGAPSRWWARSGGGRAAPAAPTPAVTRNPARRAGRAGERGPDAVTTSCRPYHRGGGPAWSSVTPAADAAARRGSHLHRPQRLAKEVFDRPARCPAWWRGPGVRRRGRGRHADSPPVLRQTRVATGAGSMVVPHDGQRRREAAGRPGRNEADGRCSPHRSASPGRAVAAPLPIDELPQIVNAAGPDVDGGAARRCRARWRCTRPRAAGCWSSESLPVAGRAAARPALERGGPLTLLRRPLVAHHGPDDHGQDLRP